MRANACWLLADLPAEGPQFAQIFAYGASGPAFDAAI
jgi:hypothetical protein